MSYRANRRRLKALTALVAVAPFAAATMVPASLYAQTVAPSPAGKTHETPPGMPQGGPIPNRPVPNSATPRKSSGNIGTNQGTVGSWSFASAGNHAQARLLPEKIKGGAKANQVGGSGGRARIEIEYWSVPGPRHGFSGNLIVDRIGMAFGGAKTHVFVDGKEVDSFMTGDSSQRRDLKKLFGDDLSGLAKARNMRVTMEIGGKTHDIFDADLEGTPDLFKKMAAGPKAHQSATIHNFDEPIPLGPTGPVNGSGKVGPWSWGVWYNSKQDAVGSDASINLKNVNVQGPKRFVKTARGGLLDETPPRGGSANIKIDYNVDPEGHGTFSGNLVVTRIGDTDSTKTHVLVDGKEIDSFEVSQPEEKRDIKKLFGDDLSGLTKAKDLRVTMDIDGKSYDILEVDFFDGVTNYAAAVVTTLKSEGDQNYRAAQAQAIAQAPGKCEDLRRGQMGVSRAEGLYGPWDYRYVATEGSAKLYLRLDLNTGAARSAKKFVSVARGGLLDEKPPRGGTANIEFFYVSRPGPQQGFGGNLVVTRIGETGSYKTHVFVDGKEVDSFETSHPQEKRDLKKLFGDGIAGLRGAKTVRVAMDIDGKSYDILNLDLFDKEKDSNTADVVATKMEQAAQRYDRFTESNADEFKHWCGLARMAPHQGGGGKKCFITTACCEIVGLADDCFELTMLRRFRDRVLTPTVDGRRDIRRYYALAPLVLDEMRRRGEARRLLRLYFSHILPCAIGAKLGLVALPRWHYRDMMQRLVCRYLPDQLALMA